MIIYKYILQDTIGENQILALPKDAEILHFALQHDEWTIWCLLPVQNITEHENRTFLITGTGWNIHLQDKEHLEHIGTVLVDNGNFVWHLFEIT